MILNQNERIRTDPPVSRHPFHLHLEYLHDLEQSLFAVPRRTNARRAYQRVETEPGLHTFADDAQGCNHPSHLLFVTQPWNP